MANLSDIWTTVKPCPYNCSGNLTTKNLATQCHIVPISFTSMNSSLQISTIAVIILHIVTSIFAVVINLLIMVALVTKEQMRTAANLILTNMAFSDFLVGLLVQPCTLSIQIVDVTGGSSCTLRRISNFLGSLCVGASFATTAMFAFDRCFAVSMPFEYSLSRLCKKYSIAMVAIWVVLAVLVILTNIGLITYRVFETLMILLLLAAFITVIVCYIKVYIAIINQRNKVISAELGTITPSAPCTGKYDAKSSRVFESTLASNTKEQGGKSTIKMPIEAENARSELRNSGINVQLEATVENTCCVKNGFGSPVKDLSPNETSFVTDTDRKLGGSVAISPFEAAREEPFSINRKLEVPVKVKAKEHPCEIIISIADDSLAANTAACNFQARVTSMVSHFDKDDRGCNDSQRKISTVARQKSGTNTVAALVASMLMCYLPITMLNILRNHLQLDIVTVKILYQWGNFLIVLNSSINPVIYCIRVQTIRQAVKQVWRKFINCVFIE